MWKTTTEIYHSKIRQKHRRQPRRSDISCNWRQKIQANGSEFSDRKLIFKIKCLKNIISHKLVIPPLSRSLREKVFSLNRPIDQKVYFCSTFHLSLSISCLIKSSNMCILQPSPPPMRVQLQLTTSSISRIHPLCHSNWLSLNECCNFYFTTMYIFLQLVLSHFFWVKMK